MATVTLLQKQSAQNIVNRLRDKILKIEKEPMEEETNKVFFWILNNMADKIEKKTYNVHEISFLLVLRDFSMPKGIYLMVNGVPSNSILINISTIKDARTVIRNVSEIFNFMDNWNSEYKPYMERKVGSSTYGVLKVSVKAN